MDTNIAQNRTSIPDEAPQQARDRATSASFGDNGTTATANAHGHLLQITRYLGNKSSGFFCADLPSAPEPWYVESRMDHLQRSCKNPARGMRLLLDGEDGEKWKAKQTTGAFPKMSFLHDRWPSFITETPSFSLDIQYLISQSTVYQIYTFKLKEGSQSPPKIPRLAINANLLIRNLEFSNYDEENEREGYDKHYSHQILHDGHSIATVHRVDQIVPDDKDAVGLFISVFLNGRLQKFAAAENPKNYKDLDDLEDSDDSDDSGDSDDSDDSDDSHDSNDSHDSEDSEDSDDPEDFQDLEDHTYYEITPDQQAIISLSEQKSLKVTVAYRLDIVSSVTLKEMLPIFSSENLVGAENIMNSPFSIIQFSEEQHLNYILRRNLEHILSVCCIPTGDPAYRTAIALTCGDISGHRIATTASFYAFQILLNALKYFKINGPSCSCPAGSSLCEDYACKLSFRIKHVCQGHIKWLSNAHKKLNNNMFSTSYWASGEKISGYKISPEVPITNTLFNFIKAAGFCQLVADENTRHGIKKDYKHMATHLVNTLHQNNKNNEYIFPRFKERTPHTFYSSDHAIIWWAIKSAEELGLKSRCYIPQDVGQQEMSYSSSKVQKSMIMKMTTENLDAKKTMLATSRSLSEDNFVLGTDDTILFHAMSVGLFDKKNSIEDKSDFWKNKVDAWKNIVYCQEDQDTSLNNPLQIALVFILSANNSCIDSRLAGEVYDFTKSVLFASSSSNGLFPGQLDENQEPILFDNESSRDSYWHVTFEVPYILWNYQQRRPIEDYKLTVEHITDRRLSELVHGMEAILGRIDTVTASSTAAPLKRKVNEIPNEWLYDEPKFFKSHEDVSSDSIAQFCEENEYTHHGMVIDDAILSVQGQDGHEAYKGNIAGYIIDVPRNKGLYVKTRTFDLKELIKGESLDPCFKEKRTPAISKKQLLHFYPLSQYVALACFLASSERDAIASFFDRHASYDRYFSEATSLALNKWVTEMHLPFYQISDQEPISSKFQTVAKMVSTPFMRSNEREEYTIFINRATMSFRFDGDIFDRYWTCHFIEHSPRIISKERGNEYKGEQNPHNISTGQIEGASKPSSWRQRKILELILFDLMLEEILRSTKEILEEARLRIKRSFRPETTASYNHKTARSMTLDPLDLIDTVDNSMFLTTNSLWNELEPIFHLIKDALHENLEIIARWTDRERSRGRDEPQWTLHDESSYRGAISALQNSNRQRIHELKRCDSEITSFNALFARKLEVMRSELDRRGADDIRLFTYVTVVFLPVGFATSVFSMSGSPPSDTLHGMIILAILALSITFIALVNARILDKVLGPIFGACRTGTEAIINPLIGGLNILIHPISKPVYLLFCRSVYGIAFPLLKRFWSPEDSGKDNEDPGTNDIQTKELEQGTQNDNQDSKKIGHEVKQKHDKQITELGPIRAARRNTLIMRLDKKAKEQQEIRDMEREVKREKEETFKEEEEENFKTNEQTKLNETILKTVDQIFKQELKESVEAEFETELETFRKYRGVMSEEDKTKMKNRLKKEIEPKTKERFVKEGKRRIRRLTNSIIKDRVKKRIEKEVKERMEEKRKTEEEESRRFAKEAQKAKGSIIRRFVGNRAQSASVKTANGEIGEGILKIA